MRGVETRIQEIRHRVFREVARMAYHTEWPVDKRIESLPYKIIPGEVGNFRNDVFWSGPSWASGCGWPWACPARSRGGARPALGEYRGGRPAGDLLHPSAHQRH